MCLNFKTQPLHLQWKHPKPLIMGQCSWYIVCTPYVQYHYLPFALKPFQCPFYRWMHWGLQKSVLQGHSADKRQHWFLRSWAQTIRLRPLCSTTGQEWWSSSACRILPWLPISHGLLFPQGPVAVAEMLMDPAQVSGGCIRLPPTLIITLMV